MLRAHNSKEEYAVIKCFCACQDVLINFNLVWSLSLQFVIGKGQLSLSYSTFQYVPWTDLAFTQRQPADRNKAINNNSTSLTSLYYDVTDTLHARSVRRLNRMTCCNDANCIAKCVLLAGHGMDNTDLAENISLAAFLPTFHLFSLSLSCLFSSSHSVAAHKHNLFRSVPSCVHGKQDDESSNGGCVRALLQQRVQLTWVGLLSMGL